MGKSVTTWTAFQTELSYREQDLAAMLPRHVSVERFTAAAVAAVKQEPGLLRCDMRTLFAAVTKSAQDGLLADGREGVIVKYGNEAQWQPMVYGLRKRARELDKIIVFAEVVHEHDEYDIVLGDDPRIEHKPLVFGDRGEKLGAYAIFKDGEGNILHREVMGRDDILKVKSQSRQQDGLLWGKFESEAWKKTVVRRGFKSVPVGEELDQIVTRDDETYDFKPQPVAGATELPPTVGSRRAPAEVVEGTATELPPSVEENGDDTAEEQDAGAGEAGPSEGTDHDATEPADAPEGDGAASQAAPYDIPPALDRRHNLWTLADDGSHRYVWGGVSDADSADAQAALFRRLTEDFAMRPRTEREVEIARAIEDANTELIKNLPDGQYEKLSPMIDAATDMSQADMWGP